MLTFSTSVWTAPELRPILRSPRSGRPKHRRAWAAVRTLRRMSKDCKAVIIRNPWNSMENIMVQCPINLGVTIMTIIFDILWPNPWPFAISEENGLLPWSLWPTPCQLSHRQVASHSVGDHLKTGNSVSGSSQHRSSRFASQIGLNGMSQNQVKPGIEPNPKKGYG